MLILILIQIEKFKFEKISKEIGIEYEVDNDITDWNCI